MRSKGIVSQSAKNEANIDYNEESENVERVMANLKTLSSKNSGMDDLV